MNKIQIVTDSSVRLTKDEIEEYEIEVVPLRIDVDGHNYIDGIEISPEEFVDKMKKSKNLPKTSQPPLGDFVGIYSKYASQNRPVISIHMAASLSGTVNVAREAAKISHGEVTVIDSDFTDRAQSFQVLKAAKMAQKGATKDEILKAIDQVKKETCLYLAFPTLTNLIKGGRISRVTGMMSTLIRLKLIVKLENQELIPVKKTRGMKGIEQYFNDLVDRITKIPNLHSVGLSYVDNYEFGKKFEDKIHRVRPDVSTLLSETGPVIATHAGDKALAIIYY